MRRVVMREWMQAGLAAIVALMFSGALFAAEGAAAEKASAEQLIEMAKANGLGLRDAIVATLDAKEMKEGTAWMRSAPEFSSGPEAGGNRGFFWVELGGPLMRNFSRSDIW